MKKRILTIIMTLMLIFSMTFGSYAQTFVPEDVVYTPLAVVGGLIMANGMVSTGSVPSVAELIYSGLSTSELADLQASANSFQTVSPSLALAQGTIGSLTFDAVKQRYAELFVASTIASSGTYDTNPVIPATWTNYTASASVLPASAITAYNASTYPYKMLIKNSSTTVMLAQFNTQPTIVSNGFTWQVANPRWTISTGEYISPTGTQNVALYSTTSHTFWTIYANNFPITSVQISDYVTTVMTPGFTLPIRGTSGGVTIPWEQDPAYAPGQSGAWERGDSPSVPLTLPYNPAPTTDMDLPQTEVGVGTVATGMDDLRQRIIDLGLVIGTITGTIANLIDLTRTDADTWDSDISISQPLPTTTVPEIEKMKLPALAMSRFPMSIPFDIARMFTGFVQPAAVPRWEIPFQIARFGIDESLVLDFEEFGTLAAFSRYCTGALFTIVLAVGTRDLIRG